MASGLTHLLISKYSLNEVSRRDIAALLASRVGEFALGSVAPDLPYMSQFDLRFGNQKAYADDFHYRKTNEIPLRGLETARGLLTAGEDRAIVDALYAFYLGYSSHVMADGIFHPYVRDWVGDYDVAAKQHRVLEMKLDVLICKHFQGTEINFSEIQDDLEWFDESAQADNVCSSFSTLIRDVHGQPATPEMLHQWRSSMNTVFEFAEGEVPKWYRDLMGEQGISFKNYDDLKAEEGALTQLMMPIDAAKHGLITNFSGKPRITIFGDVLPLYMKKFPALIESSYRYVYEGADLDLDLLPPINLDNGRLLSNQALTQIPAYWS